MRSSRKALALLALLLLVAGAVEVLLWSYGYYHVESTARIGQPFPALRLADLHGRRVDFTSYSGRKLVAVFVDPACGFCQKQFQVLRELRGKFAGEGISVVVVVRHDSLLPVDLSPGPDDPFPVWVDARRQLRRRLGAQRVPALFLLDERGILRRKATGYQTVAALEKMIDSTEGA